MYQSYEYIGFSDFNKIENKIDELTNLIKTVNPNIPKFVKNNWKMNDFVYIEKVDKIEKAIESLKEFFFKPDGWITSKVWIEDLENIKIKSFSYIDINRWLSNLSVIESSFTLNITIWDGITQMNWEQESVEEWK